MSRSKRRTTTTRSQSVRFNSKQLAEMVLFMEREKGWRIESLGGFMRDLFETFHNVLSEQEGFEFLSNSAEAEEVLQQFQTGRVNKRHLSLTVNQERLGRDDPFYRPITSDEKRNDSRRGVPVNNETSLDISNKDMPKDISDKYSQLDMMHKEIVNNLMSMGQSWDNIRSIIENMDDSATNSQGMDEAKAAARNAGVLSEGEFSDLTSDDSNDYESVNEFRKAVDREQEETMKEELRTPPSNIVSDSDEDEE